MKLEALRLSYSSVAAIISIGTTSSLLRAIANHIAKPAS